MSTELTNIIESIDGNVAELTQQQYLALLQDLNDEVKMRIETVEMEIEDNN